MVINLKALVPALMFGAMFALHSGNAFASDLPKIAMDKAEPPATVGPVLRSEALVAVQATMVNRELQDWNTRLARAQANRKKGTRYVLYGLGTIGVGTVVGIAMAGSADSYGQVESASAIYALSSLAGTGLAVYGAIKWYGAKDEIEDLDLEGRQKGYLTLTPLPKGVLARASFSF